MNAAFASFFVTLWVGHTFADHWVQTDAQAQNKGRRDATGRHACFMHVLTLTITQSVLLPPVFFLIGAEPSWSYPVALLFNAITHYWIDRRFTLAGLCEKLGKGPFYRMGTGLGTGAYALDQSAHVLMLFVSALIMAVGVR